MSDYDALVAKIKAMDDEIDRLARMTYSPLDISARVYNSANFTHTSTGNFQSITFDSEDFDTDGMHSTTSDTDRLTVVSAGKYIVGATVLFTANSTGQRQLRLMKNGLNIKTQARTTTSDGSINELLTMTTILYLAVDDYLQCQAYQNSGGNLDLVYSDGVSPVFWAAKL